MILNITFLAMSDIKETINLASRLENADPIDSPQSNDEFELLSSYFSSIDNNWDGKSNAFLNDITMDNHISNITESSNKAREDAESLWLDLCEYNPLAEEEAKILAAQREQQAKELEKQKEKEKIRAQQKEKFTKFLKWQSEKDRKLWYSRWVISGLLLSLWIFIFWILFFKQDIIDFLNKDFDRHFYKKTNISTQYIAEKLWLSQKLILTDNKTINNVINLNRFLSFSDDIYSDYLNDILTSLPFIDKSEAVNIAPIREIQNEVYNTPNNEKDLSIKNIFEENNYDNDEIKESKNLINIENEDNADYYHVENIEEANRVISKDCDNFYCWDYTQVNPEEIVLCQEFKQKEDLEDNSRRIWNSWTCRYKDNSELVYLNIK